jgi:integrase
LVLIKLLSSNALRRRNLVYLTWRADDTGQLYRKADGSWWIRIPKQQFKNWYGAAREFDYDSPVHPSAWADIEKYLFVHRKLLMRGPTDLVFLTLAGPHSAKENRPWIEMSSTVSTLTNRYLLKSPGIGTHAFRHIVATAILKANGGDHKTAAQVLNDRVSTVERHYAGLRSADGAIRMAQLLDAPFSRM